MIDIITPERYADYRAELDEMHRFRDLIFRVRMGWEVHSVDGREIDEFDALRPTYLLARDAAGSLIGTWRLLPTTGPYMIRDVFPVLLEGRPAPRDPHIWETSRFAVDFSEAANGGLSAVSRATQELFCGLIEYGIARNITDIVTAYDIRIARLLRRIGCEPKWKSGHHRLGDTIAVAGQFEVSEPVLQRVRSLAGIPESVLDWGQVVGPRRAA